MRRIPRPAAPAGRGVRACRPHVQRPPFARVISQSTFARVSRPLLLYLLHPLGSLFFFVCLSSWTNLYDQVAPSLISGRLRRALGHFPGAFVVVAACVRARVRGRHLIRGLARGSAFVRGRSDTAARAAEFTTIDRIQGQGGYLLLFGCRQRHLGYVRTSWPPCAACAVKVRGSAVRGLGRARKRTCVARDGCRTLFFFLIIQILIKL